MSSFYGNGGYSSGGGGGSGEVISVNGKKGQVTLDAADVHALSDDTQIPSLEGFATEAWVNESINSLPKNDSTWLGGAFLGKNQFNDIEKVIIPFGSFKGEFPGVVQYEGDYNDLFFKLQHIQQIGFNLNNLGVILTIGEYEHPDYLNFYIDNADLVIPITSIAPPNNNLKIRVVIDENGNISSFKSILESKVMNYFNKGGQSISKVTFVILDSFNNNQNDTNTFPIEITLQQVQDHADVYRANYTVDEVITAIDNGLMTYAYIKDDTQNKNYYLISNSTMGPVFAYIDSQANNISTIRFMNQYGGDNRVIIKTDIPIIHSHQDISGKADKTEIPTKVSDLTNDAGYLTQHQDLSTYALKSTVYTKAQVDTALQVKADVSDVLAPLVGDADDITPQDVINALAEGRNISVTKAYTFENVDWNLTFTTWNRVVDVTYSGNVADLAISQTIAIFNGNFYLFEMVGGKYNEDMPWTITSSQIITAQELMSHCYDKDTINDMMSEKSDKSTTLSGYGITDAYTKTETYSKSEVDNLINSRREKQTIYITHSGVVANDASKITSISNLSPNLSLLDLINTPVVINNERVTYIKQASIASSSSIGIVFENFANTLSFIYSISTGQISVISGGASA